MAVRYAWECPECQDTIELATKQAGQELNCASCSAKISAPKLGVIKSLAPVGGQQAAAPRSRRSGGGGNALKSWLFAGGLLLAVLAGVAGAAAQYRANQFHRGGDVDIEQIIEREMAAIDAQSPAEVYGNTIAAGQEAFALDYSETSYRKYSIMGGVIQTVAWVCWGLTGVGVLMLLSSFFLKK